jgi:alpha-mannosidase
MCHGSHRGTGEPLESGAAFSHPGGKESMKTVFLVPHTHYDVVWAFTKEDYQYINEMILRKALQMIKNCDYRFLIEQAYPIEQIEQRDPKFFAELKEAIATGKMEVVDGQYMMPDLIIPHGETLVREIMVGKHYLKDALGIDVPVAWASDGFGLNAQMPQIYKKAGYRWLVFRRGLPKSIGYRVCELLWEGLDGSKIPAHWMPFGYRAGLDPDNWEDTIEKLSRLATTPQLLLPCGSGGVPPLEETPDRVRQWNQQHTDIRMVTATPREFWESFEKEKKKLTSYRGELYSEDLENVFPDVVASRIRLKLAIKNSETILLEAEKLATFAYIHGRPYPTELLKNLWRKMLFLAHHDVLPCSGIDEIYKEAWDYVADIKKATSSLTLECVRFLSKTRAKKKGKDILVFNANTWEASDWVEAKVAFEEGWTHEPGICLNGEEIPSEVIDPVRGDDGALKRCKIGFRATVPSLGYRVYKLGKKNRQFPNEIEVNDDEIITPFFNLQVDKETGILQVFDKEGTRILEGNELIIDEEIGDLYFHASLLDQCIGAEGGAGIRFGAFRPVEFRVEPGPVRTVITYKSEYYCLRWPYYLTEKFGNLLYRHKTIEVCKQVMVYSDSPRIDFMTRLDTKQSHVRIRLRFDTCMVAPAYLRQTQFGVIDLPYEKTLEDGIKTPSLYWLNAEADSRGLGFFSAAVPINEVKAGTIHYTLLRSVSVLSADGISGPLIPVPDAMELGQHSFVYSVYPYSGQWRSALMHRRASEFSRRLIPIPLEAEPAKKEFRGLTLEPDNLMQSCLKKAEHDDSVILRFFETKGERCRAHLHLPPQFRTAKLANLLEEEEADLEIRHGHLKMNVGPFEIVTLKLFVGS